jgi:hypothetical protein
VPIPRMRTMPTASKRTIDKILTNIPVNIILL